MSDVGQVAGQPAAPLIGPDAATVAGRVRGIADQLHGGAPDLPGRLWNLADAVERADAQAPYWASLDLPSYFDIDALARWTAPSRPFLWSLINLVRNVLVLFPVVVTWLGIASAVSAYQADIAARSSDSQMPFLLLWQLGFNGHLTLWTLSQVAAMDAAIVIVVVVLTVLSELQRIRANGPDEVTARRAEIRQALADAAHLLARHRADRPEPWLAELMGASRELLQEVRTQRGRSRELAQLNAKQAQHLAAVGAHLEASATQLGTMLRDLAAFTKSLDRSSRSLFDKAEAAASRQADAIAGLQSANQGLAEALARQKGESDERRRALDAVVEYQKQIGTIAATLQEGVAGMASASGDLHSVVRAAARLIDHVEGVELVVDAGPERAAPPSVAGTVEPPRSRPPAPAVSAAAALRPETEEVYPSPPTAAALAATTPNPAGAAVAVAPAAPAAPAQGVLLTLRRWFRFR